jgi:hypothetical protein
LNTDWATKLLTVRRMGWVVAPAVCVLLVALAVPASGGAKRGLVTGLTGVDQYQTSDKAERTLWFNRTVDAGAGIIRLGITWPTVAPGSARPPDPTNPGSTAYDFSSIDGAVRDAQARGLKVMLTVNTAPTWAEGPGRPASAAPGSWKPNPTDVADFIQTVAARYSGNFDPDGAGPQPVLPFADALQVWNEPNQDTWLAPQFQGKAIIGPDYYRVMLNASFKAIKSVNPQMLVVTGGTSPYGDPPGGPYPPGGARVRPVQWWEEFLCVRLKKGKKKKGKKPKHVRTGCAGQPLFDVLAHQPIDNTGGGPMAHGPHGFDASTPDLRRVVDVLRAGERLGTVSGGKHPVWVTEFWWDSKPPNPVGAPLGKQARWLEQSLYLFWKGGADTAINFAIRDSTEFPDARNGFQSGLFFLDGRPKPALTAFRFPFVTERINKRSLGAWGKSPAAGKLVIQRKQGGRWKSVKKLRVGKGSVFTAKLKLSGKQRLRATVAGERSLVWKQAAAGARNSSDGGPSAKKIALAAAAALIFSIVLVTALRARRRRRAQELGNRIRELRSRRSGTRPVTG